jgi:hypothetical protein
MVGRHAHGGGTTLAEAVAVAWINTCIWPWSEDSRLSDEDYAQVQRSVPEGWKFKLHKAPVRDAVLKVIQGSPDLLLSDKVLGGKRNPWSDGH